MQHIWLFYSPLSTAFASGRAPEVDVRANAATTEIKDRQVTTFVLFLNNHITKPRPGSETRHLRADNLMAGKTQWARPRDDLNAKDHRERNPIAWPGMHKTKMRSRQQVY
jgi:hypothetical protein